MNRRLGDYLRSSLWPIPLLMLLAAVGLVQATRVADAHLAGSEALRIWWLHSGNGDDARNLLSTLVAAIMTIASVVFSITIVALTLAANQFGSRLVRTYMRDTGTKLSLGFFLLTIVFCLLALRLVSQEMAPQQVPHVTVTTGLLLGVLCVLVLVLFLHGVARSVIADEVVRRVAAELDAAIEELPPATGRPQEYPGGELLPADFESRSTVLRSDREGYVQQVRYERLAAVARQQGLVLRLDVSAGDYMCKNGWTGRVYPASSCPDSILHAIRESVELGPERTPVQDLAFPIRHLVDVALRALSPGINDANTALVVIDHVRGALARLLERSLPTGVFHDETGTCRVLGQRRTHHALMAAALHPIRDAAARQPLVIAAMLRALEKLAEHARLPEHADAIRQEAQLIAEAGLQHPMLPSEKAQIGQALREVGEKLARVRAA
jgi:uncharacterized membrane protein